MFHLTESLENKVLGSTFWLLPRCAEAMALRQGLDSPFEEYMLICCCETILQCVVITMWSHTWEEGEENERYIIGMKPRMQKKWEAGTGEKGRDRERGREAMATGDLQAAHWLTLDASASASSSSWGCGGRGRRKGRGKEKEEDAEGYDAYVCIQNNAPQIEAMKKERTDTTLQTLTWLRISLDFSAPFRDMWGFTTLRSNWCSYMFVILIILCGVLCSGVGASNQILTHAICLSFSQRHMWSW